MTAKQRLEADRAELARFVEAAFRYADDGTAAVLRTFAEGSNEVLTSVRVQLNGAGLDALVAHAAHQATRAANATRPAVFAPPVATFIGSRTRERDLGNGLVLTVEADHAPTVARRNLEFMMGSASVVVASGGQWADPETGAVEDKLHLHWRCREPSRSAPEHAALTRRGDHLDHAGRWLVGDRYLDHRTPVAPHRLLLLELELEVGVRQIVAV